MIWGPIEIVIILSNMSIQFSTAHVFATITKHIKDLFWRLDDLRSKIFCLQLKIIY